MFSQLYQIVQFHFKTDLALIAFEIIHNFIRISTSSNIPRQERRLMQDRIAPYGHSKIIHNRKSPFYEGIALFNLILQIRVFGKIDIMLNEKSIEVVVD